MHIYQKFKQCLRWTFIFTFEAKWSFLTEVDWPISWINHIRAETCKLLNVLHYPHWDWKQVKCLCLEQECVQNLHKMDQNISLHPQAPNHLKADVLHILLCFSWGDGCSRVSEAWERDGGLHCWLYREHWAETGVPRCGAWLPQGSNPTAGSWGARSLWRCDQGHRESHHARGNYLLNQFGWHMTWHMTHLSICIAVRCWQRKAILCQSSTTVLS